MSGVSNSDASSSGETPVFRKCMNWVRALWRKLFLPDGNWQPALENGGNPVMYEDTYTPRNTPIVIQIAPPWDSIETVNGSILIFCGDQCLNSYVINAGEEDEHYAPQTKAPQSECVYCYWCSIRIHEPDTCFTHGNHCPIVSWKYTHQALECYNELFCLFASTGRAIPAELLDEVEDIAEMYGPDLPGRAIARIAHKGWEFFQ